MANLTVENPPFIQVPNKANGSFRGKDLSNIQINK
jgi:hypothetical protein